MSQPQRISVIGDGAWGTTLAIVLAEKKHDVILWGPFGDYLKKVSKTRENSKFLPGIKLPQNIDLTDDIQVAIEASDIIVIATPSQFLVQTLKHIKKTNYEKKIFVSVVKGLEEKSFLTMTDVIQKILGKVPVVALSGPTIAIEVAKKIPTTIVAASQTLPLAKKIQEIFNTDVFRVYTNTDVIGVELCGCVKNIIALSCGICDGLGLGTNTKAAILTRGLVEMKRLGKALKAKPDTFSGLAGLGDLATTCFSPNSRNRSVGEALGKGKSLKAILEGMNAVAEGVPATKAVYKLALKKKIEMPITKAVFQILYKKKSPKKAVSDLMSRSLKKE